MSASVAFSIFVAVIVFIILYVFCLGWVLSQAPILPEEVTPNGLFGDPPGLRTNCGQCGDLDCDGLDCCFENGTGIPGPGGPIVTTPNPPPPVLARKRKYCKRKINGCDSWTMRSCNPCDELDRRWADRDPDTPFARAVAHVSRASDPKIRKRSIAAVETSVARVAEIAGSPAALGALLPPPGDAAVAYASSAVLLRRKLPATSYSRIAGTRKQQQQQQQRGGRDGKDPLLGHGSGSGSGGGGGNSGSSGDGGTRAFLRRLERRTAGTSSNSLYLHSSSSDMYSRLSSSSSSSYRKRKTEGVDPEHVRLWQSVHTATFMKRVASPEDSLQRLGYGPAFVSPEEISHYLAARKTQRTPAHSSQRLLLAPYPPTSVAANTHTTSFSQHNHHKAVCIGIAYHVANDLASSIQLPSVVSKLFRSATGNTSNNNNNKNGSPLQVIKGAGSSSNSGNVNTGRVTLNAAASVAANAAARSRAPRRLRMAPVDAAVQERAVRETWPAMHSTLLLTDETPYQPTRTNVLSAFQWLVGGATANASLFLSLSCHGRLDGSLVSAEGARIGTADLLHTLIQPLDRTGARLVVFADCCNADVFISEYVPFVYEADSLGDRLVEHIAPSASSSSGLKSRLDVDVVVIGTFPTVNDSRGGGGGGGIDKLSSSSSSSSSSSTARMAASEMANGGGAGHLAFLNAISDTDGPLTARRVERSIQAVVVRAQQWLDEKRIAQRFRIASSRPIDVGRLFADIYEP